MMDDDDAPSATGNAKPPWLAPALIAVVVLAIIYGARKKEEVAENAIVDMVVIAVSVAAIWAVFRKIAAMLDAPGLATFFGAPVQPHPDHPDTISD